MSLDATYHRTFLPDGPFESDCRQTCHPDARPKGNRLEPFQPQFTRDPNPHALQPLHPAPEPFQMPTMTDRGKKYYRSQKRRPAYMFVSGELKSIHIVEKIDQKFASVATPWEHEFSALTKDGANRFAPLVDENYQVVGHVGARPGDKMYVGKDPDVPPLSGDRIADYLADDEAIYVAAKAPDGWEPFDHLYPMTIYTVVTGIDGYVISGQATGGMPGAVSVAGPVEYITGTVAVLKLGAVVVRGLIKSLVRTQLVANAIREISGPTKKVLGQLLAKRAARKAARAAAKHTYDPVTGITREHHAVFVQGAAESNLIIVVRHTNPKSIPLIELRCPGKPKNLEFINTSPETGIVMAKTGYDVSRAQKLGYYVVNPDGRTATRFVKLGDKEVPEIVPLNKAFWKVEPGQVIHPTLNKPIVGDYDLMGVIDPGAPGRVVALATRNKGELVTDLTNPVVQRAADAVNKGFDMKRVLHGPQDFYKGFRKGATAYEPNGTVRHFRTEDEVKGFYDKLGRQTREGSHPRPAPGTPVDDELARARLRKQQQKK